MATGHMTPRDRCQTPYIAYLTVVTNRAYLEFFSWSPRKVCRGTCSLRTCRHILPGQPRTGPAVANAASRPGRQAEQRPAARRSIRLRHNEDARKPEDLRC